MPGQLELLAGQYKSQDQNWLTMFARSLMGSAGGLIGMEAPADVQAWDQSHPTAALAASLGVGLGYTGGALKLARLGALGRYGTWVDNIGKEWNPILRYGSQEALRMLPFDAGRVGISAFSGGDTDSVAVDAVLNLGLSAGIGAGFGAFEAAGKPLLRKWGQVYDGSRLSPLQLQSRDLRRRFAEGVFDESTAKEAQRQLGQWRLGIIGEKQPQNGVLERALENGGNTKELNRALFNLTNDKPGQMPIRQPLLGTAKAGQFISEKELKLVSEKMGLADDWHDFVQHPRIVSPRTVDAKRNLEATLNRNMSRVGSDAWIAKEKDGLYVVAKRHPDQEHYFSFKTDEPTRFLDDGGMYKKTEEMSAWLRQPDAREASLIDSVQALKEAKAFRDAIPVAMLKEAPKAGVGQYLDKSAGTIAKFLGYNPEVGGAKKVVGDFLHRYLSPAINQFTMPEARYSMAGANRLFDLARSNVAEEMVGAQELQKEGFLKSAAVGGAVRPGSRVDMINKLTDEDLSDISRILYKGEGIEEAKAAGMSERGLEYLAAAKAFDKKQTDAITALEDLLGLPKKKRLKFLENHMGLMRTYDGDYLIPVMEGKKTVAIAGGKSIGQAQKEAQRIVEVAQGKGRSWFFDAAKPPIFRGDGADMALFNRLNRDPDNMLIMSEGRSIRDEPFTSKRMTTQRVKSVEVGFQGSEVPLTRQQLIDNHMRIMTQNERYIADLSWRHSFKDLNTTVSGLEPQVWHQMEQRINDHLGIKNEFDRWVNKTLDPLLAPFIGRNSASRLVRGLNSIQFHLNFGAANVAFPMLQLAQFTQTVMPEIAFLQHGAAGRLAQYYTNWAVGGLDGKPRTVLGMLDIFKLMGRGFKIMGNPSKALAEGADEYVMLMNGAMKRGTLEPGSIDEFIGDAARQKLSALEKLKDTSNLWQSFSRLNLFAPKAAERLSRLHAATVAFDFGKNVMGFQGRNLENFIDEFTKRTMFGYSIADRPRIFTGPFGSAFGLFKNWQLNYLHMLGDYLGEGFGRNNWKPLLWSFVGASSIGGIGSGGAMYAAADGMSQLLGNDSLMNLWYDNFQRDPNSGNWSDALFLGLPAFLPTLVGLPGVSFTTQAALPGSDPSRDISQLMNFVYLDRLKAVGQLGDALVSAQGNIFSNEQVQGAFLRAFAPKTVYRTQQILADGVINSSSSIYPTQSGLSQGEQLLYALGFNPNNVELGFRAGDELWRDQQKNLQVVQSLGSSWAEAELRGDWDSLDKIMKRAMLEGVDMDKVWKSANVRLGKANQDLFQRQFDSGAVERYQQSGVLR